MGEARSEAAPEETSRRSAGRGAVRTVKRRPPSTELAAPDAEARSLARSDLRAHPAFRLLNIGYGNVVTAGRIVAIVSPQSSPMRRLREEAGARGKLVDATQGRRTRSILVTDSDHVILSALNPETIAARLAPEDDAGAPGE